MSILPDKDPWYVDLFRWSRRLPVYVGLPLALLGVLPLLVADIVHVLCRVPGNWRIKAEKTSQERADLEEKEGGRANEVEANGVN